MPGGRANTPTSESDEYFGWQDFDVKRDDVARGKACPVRACIAPLLQVPTGKSERAFCPVHGIRLHANTFVYWNGDGRSDKAHLRNFRIRPDLARKYVFASTEKAETHRLGHEMSEDALSWNVFAGLLDAGALRDATEFLTGRKIAGQPELYLWGERIDLAGGEPRRFEMLEKVGRELEREIRHFRTEPDVILHVPGQIVVCIEAKFGSGNTLAHDSNAKADEKPTSVEGLVKRYLDRSSERTRKSIDRGAIGSCLHGQLFRNIIFASEMAGKEDWQVVNLVSNEQWKETAPTSRSIEYSFENPEKVVRAYLNPDHRDRFTYRTWEDLYRRVVKEDKRLKKVADYMLSKSAHYKSAFKLA